MTQLPSGEARERRRQFEYRLVAIGLFAVGLPIGMFVGMSVAKDGGLLDGTWPPALALGILAIYLVTLAIGTWRIHRVTDEVINSNLNKAGMVAANAMLNGYPVWFLLWKAGWVGEPIHWVLYIAFLASFIAAAFYYRFK